MSLRWRHNKHDSVSNHRPHDCLLNRLFRRRSKNTSKLRVTGLCLGNSPGAGQFPAQMNSNAENVSIWWRQHVKIMPNHCSPRDCFLEVLLHKIIFEYISTTGELVKLYTKPIIVINSHSALCRGIHFYGVKNTGSWSLCENGSGNWTDTVRVTSLLTRSCNTLCKSTSSRSYIPLSIIVITTRMCIIRHPYSGPNCLFTYDHSAANIHRTRTVCWAARIISMPYFWRGVSQQKCVYFIGCKPVHINLASWNIACVVVSSKKYNLHSR